jgi:DNA-binding PadR family transcriptional regulator
MQFVEEETNGRLSLGAGTLYGAITTLSKKGWIELIKEEGNKKKKIYLITDLGKSVVESELKRLNDVLSTANKIIEMG